MLEVLKHHWSMTLLIILLLSSISIRYQACHIENTFQISNEYESHEPIVISSESDLETQRWIGNGTETSPYLIEKLNITAGTTCIVVSNIKVYLEIRDCLLQTTHALASGCSLSNCENVKLENCLIESQFQGISIHSSMECHIINNTVSYCLEAGLLINKVQNSTFHNNSFLECGVVVQGNSLSYWLNSFDGNLVNEIPLGYFSSESNCLINRIEYGQMILANCTNITIEGGDFSRTSTGIQIAFSESCKFNDTIIYDNKISGIIIRQSSNVSFSQIRIRGSELHGLDADNSTDIMITNSIIQGNMHSGVYMSSIHRVMIDNNRIFNNRGFGGIYLLNCEECIILYNDVYLNQMLGITLVDCPLSHVNGNFVEGHRNTGIYASGFNESQICGNTISSNAEGIYLRESTNCEINNNIMHDHTDFALHVYLIDYCVVENNTIIRNRNYGFYINMVASVSFFRNIVWNNWGIGFYVLNSTDCLFGLNNIYNNGHNGISLLHCMSFQILGNIVYNNERNGLDMQNSNSSGIMNNTILANEGVGLILRSGSSNLICGNLFSLNDKGNAVDNGTNNFWDCGSGRGNAWDDWNQTGFYYIEGEANSIDRYPSLAELIPTTNTTLPSTTIIVNEFLFERLIAGTSVVLVGVLALTYWIKRKQQK
jgi:parallel beta-helix repeat protein